jgi:diguanylate cyclase (GGDEF)-like protein
MPRRVLVIDDRPEQAPLLTAFFREFRGEAFALDWEATYEGGLERLLAGGHAACLLDYQLGPRSGLDLLREAAARGCATPIVFLTAEESDRVSLEALDAGALDYLLKGEITPRSLERSLRYALRLGETLAALRRMATRDELTGLPNRREFLRMLGEERDRALAAGGSFALVLADVDHFKRINDGGGHPAGDAVLREVARRLQGITGGDRTLRVGGDEFALIFAPAGRSEARAAAAAAVAAVAREPVPGGTGRPWRVTLSAGIAVLPEDAREAGALIAAADGALYAAKAGGRNRVGGGGEAGP